MKNTMCHFPDIQYVDEIVPLRFNPVNALPSSPKGMFTTLFNRGIVNADFLNGINNMSELETCIFELIDHYPENNASLERIFHLIQIWGGRMGRNFYCRQPFDWQTIEPIYLAFINAFTAIDNLNDDMLIMANNAVFAFYNALHEAHYKWMDVAFITKHSRFWMHRNMHNNMLPIYDSTFSEYVMLQGPHANRGYLLHYWRIMKAKAENEHISLAALERQLFNYYGG